MLVQRLVKANLIIILFLTIFFLVAPLIHELGHVVSALINGVDLNDITVGLYGVGLRVTISNYSSTFKPVHCAGGLTSGLALLIAYAIFSLYQRGKYTSRRLWLNFRWWLGYVLLIPAIFHLFGAYYEGVRHNEYLLGNLPTAIDFLFVLIISMIINTGTGILFSRSARQVSKPFG
jgi:hypothetical protein